jgi:uncharacterized RDD family membrane protein YckC
VRARYEVTTPESVTFSFELAGFFSRFAAWLLDLTAILGLSVALSVGVGALAPLGEVAAAVHAIVFFVINWGYFVFLEWFWGGQSLGKRALGLRVLSDDGVRITLQQSAIRNLLRVVDSLPLVYLVGGSVAALHGQGKRLGDMAAGTLVVQERHAPVPDAVVPARERYNSFVTDPEVARRVNQRVTLEERELLLELALRRERLPLGRRLQLFERLAEHLEGSLQLPRPDFLSAERYCLQVTAVLLGGQEGGVGP